MLAPPEVQEEGLWGLPGHLGMTEPSEQVALPGLFTDVACGLEWGVAGTQAAS